MEIWRGEGMSFEDLGKVMFHGEEYISKDKVRAIIMKELSLAPLHRNKILKELGLEEGK